MARFARTVIQKKYTTSRAESEARDDCTRPSEPTDWQAMCAVVDLAVIILLHAEKARRR